MKILVLQHEPVEHPGIFRDFLAEDGHEYVAVELDHGEKIPELDEFDALWVLGGPMDVWETQKYPWLVTEKAVIRDAVFERGMPFLGLCLGNQLLAEALGGSVGLSKTPEIGILEIELTENGARGVFFDGLPEKIPCLQWHSAEITVLPEGAQVLATSPDCVVQAMKWGPRAYSVQFHLEIEPDTVRSWANIPAYKSALEAALGPESATVLENEAQLRMREINDAAERVYMNWLQTAAQTNA